MDIVTGAGFRVTKNLGGRKYTLRAPSFEEAGAISDAASMCLRPTTAVINHEVREALKRAGKEDLVQAIDEHEAAQIAFQDAQVRAPIGETDREVLKEVNAEISAARQRMMKSEADRQRAEWYIRDDKDLAELRALGTKLDREEHIRLVLLCLVSWEGKGLPAVPEKIDADFIVTHLPAGDVAAVGRAAYGLMQPTKEVEKN